MLGRAIGDNGDIRQGDLGQRSNLAGMIRAQFQHEIILVRVGREDRQGNADVVVEAFGGDRSAKTVAQDTIDEMLGAGFAVAAGDGDHFAAQLPANMPGQPAHRQARVGDAKQIAFGQGDSTARSTIAAIAPPAAACFQKIMPVEVFTLEGDEKRSPGNLPRVRADGGDFGHPAHGRAIPPRRSICESRPAKWFHAPGFRYALQRHFDFLHIVEMMPGFPDDLVILVSLARDKNHVAGLGVLQRLADGGPAIGLDDDGVFPRPRKSICDLADDLAGILGARIVAGDVDDIGQLLGRAGHEGAFFAVAVAAASEQHAELSPGERSKSQQRFAQRIIRVGVIYQDGEWLAASHRLQSSGSALGVVETRGDLLHRKPENFPNQGRGGEGVGDVVLPDQSQRHFRAAVGRVQYESRSLAGQSKIPSAIIGPGPETKTDLPGPAIRGHPIRPRIVRVEHRHRVLIQIFKKLRLGRGVSIHIQVIVEMILRQIGERGPGEMNSRHAALIQRMAGDLHRAGAATVVAHRRRAA